MSLTESSRARAWSRWLTRRLAGDVAAPGFVDPPLKLKPEDGDAAPAEPWPFAAEVFVRLPFVAVPVDRGDTEGNRVTPLTDGVEPTGILEVDVVVGVLTVTDGALGVDGVVTLTERALGIVTEIGGVRGVATGIEGVRGILTGIDSETEGALGVVTETDGVRGIVTETDGALGIVNETDRAFAETDVDGRDADTDVPDSPAPQA